MTILHYFDTVFIIFLALDDARLPACVMAGGVHSIKAAHTETTANFNLNTLLVEPPGIPIAITPLGRRPHL
jgi:hypothetical protein